MALRGLLALAALLGTAGTARADTSVDAKLAAALDKGNAAAFRKLIAKEVDVARLWFDSPSCRNRFAKTRLTRKNADAFVSCMKGLGATSDGYSVFYGPGIQLVTRYDIEHGGQRLSGLRGFSLLDDPTRPFVHPDKFAMNRTQGDPLVLSEHARDNYNSESVTVVVCADMNGDVTRSLVDVPASGPLPPAFATALDAALKTWKVKPFLVRGKPISVCSVIAIAT